MKEVLADSNKCNSRDQNVSMRVDVTQQIYFKLVEKNICRVLSCDR